MMENVVMYKLDNCNNFKNRLILENFLQGVYPMQLEWDSKFLVLIESGSNIAGVLAYKKKLKVHLCVIAISEKWRNKGLGTEMLKHIAVMYPQREITLSVLFDNPEVLNFYLRKGYAEMKSIDTERKCFVLSLVNIKLLNDVSLPP